MIVILGGAGYVGQAYQRYFNKRRLPFQSLSRAQVDYTDADELREALGNLRPDFLINCAGYTGKPNVDACEDDKAACLAGNAVLPGTVRRVCAELGLPWGHVSSGCVFSGKRADGEGFNETDVPNFSFRHGPCSFYSGTKALGEEVLGYRESASGHWEHEGEPDAYVWRLRIPFNEQDGPRNYLSKLMRYERLLEATNSISQLDEFVRASVACWEKRVPFGIYNLTNPGAVSTREVVDLIKRSGVCDKDFVFFENEATFMCKAARTPRSNCVLDARKLANWGITMTPVHEAIEKALTNWSTTPVCA